MTSATLAVNFHWQGAANLEEIVLKPSRTTLSLSPQQRKAAKQSWAESGGHENKALWRYESLCLTGGTVLIHASSTTYHAHHYKQTHPTDINFPHPIPIGVTALQITEDGYALAGVQEFPYPAGPRLTLVGSGFMEQERDGTSVKSALTHECLEETKYSCQLDPAETAKVMAVITGTIGALITAIAIYVPVPLTSREVTIGSNEHRELVLIPTNKFNDILNGEDFGAIRPSCFLLGAIEAYTRQNISD